MKKFRFLSSNEWLVVMSCTAVIAGANLFWTGHSRALCVLQKAPLLYFNFARTELQIENHDSTFEIDSRYSTELSNHVPVLTIKDSTDRLVVTYTPGASENGWAICTAGFRYEFDSRSLQTKVYGRRGICIYSDS